MPEKLAGLDWNALLQKAEEGITKFEEFYTRDEPMTGIEEMRGTEHAYYEKELEEMGKLLEEAEALMNQKVTPTPPIEVSRTEADKTLPSGNLRQALDSVLMDAQNLINAFEQASVRGVDIGDIERAMNVITEMEEMLGVAKDELQPEIHVPTVQEYTHALLTPPEVPKGPEAGEP
jgi:hypothetical protein